ncbi:MAG TPA: ABC transporter substrate-binding protein [Candidatus Binatia bacterium]|jgi:phospholipid transport system substrate-binding protein
MKHAVKIVALILLICAWRPAFAGEPTESIRDAVNQGIQILDRAKLDNQKQRTQVIDRLRTVVYPLFDFREMAMRSLGPTWRRLDPRQQSDFVSAFTALLEKTYANQIDLYQGQKVAYDSENIDGNYAEVATRILDNNKGKTYSVVYRLHQVNGQWKIYDVVAENISLINNYRSQFDHFLAKSSIEDLLKTMKERAS